MNKLRHRIAWLWLATVMLLLGHNAWLWLDQRVSPDTDILALLPSTERDPVLQQAFGRMVDAARDRVVVLVGAPDWDQAQRAAAAYEGVVRAHPDLLQAATDLSTQAQGEWLGTFDHSRSVLLTAAQQTALQSAPARQWSEIARAGLYGAFAGPRTGSWRDDPFGLFAGWVQERAQETPVRPRDGRLFVQGQGRAYAVILLTLRQPAFGIGNQRRVLPVLNQANAAARAVDPAGVDIISAGMILHAAAAAQQAESEMSVIGGGSLLGILLLMWLTFRSFKPIALIALSIAVGCLGALSVSWLVFGHVHLLTLVFGASLIGIAQDYGIYFLCARLGSPAALDSPRLWRSLLPGMALMLAAALIGYGALALTPFPGLQQMAVFSGAGLVFAWLTVACWFPALVRAGSIRATPLADRYSLTLARRGRWRSWRESSTAAAILRAATVLALGLAAVVGLARLTASDDIRALQSANSPLIADQLKLGKLLDAPTPVQFYLVRGASEQIVLEREERLKRRLDPLIARHVISGYQAVSNWTPSLRTQQANRQLIEHALLAEPGPLNGVARDIGEDDAWADAVRQRMRDHAVALDPATFLATPAGEPWRHLWLGKIDGQYASVVALRGLNDYAHLPLLASLAGADPQAGDTAADSGVQWVDKAQEISSTLARYRKTMSWAVLGAYLAVFALLCLRYRRAAWRVIAAPALASILVLAMLGMAGAPLQLFHVLGCMLILGLGVDYGIFLHERSQHAPRFDWLTVSLSAASALLSFGLLALSHSPPLHAFGLTMLIGMAGVWLLAPCLAKNLAANLAANPAADSAANLPPDPAPRSASSLSTNHQDADDISPNA